MQADIDTHSAAKLSRPHLRPLSGTGARSRLKSRLFSMSNSTSGALWVRPGSEAMGNLEVARLPLEEFPAAQFPGKLAVPGGDLAADGDHAGAALEFPALERAVVDRHVLGLHRDL